MAEKPKRPLSAYMLWLNDNREQIKRDNPGIKVTEVAKRGGELWRALKDKSVSSHCLLYFIVSVRCKVNAYCECSILALLPQKISQTITVLKQSIAIC